MRVLERERGREYLKEKVAWQRMEWEKEGFKREKKVGSLIGAKGVIIGKIIWKIGDRSCWFV